LGYYLNFAPRGGLYSNFVPDAEPVTTAVLPATEKDMFQYGKGRAGSEKDSLFCTTNLTVEVSPATPVYLSK
jgi:hypothetical protein